jgi:site-specific DNA-methyltransferase (cytosine-N4-specific)
MVEPHNDQTFPIPNSGGTPLPPRIGSSIYHPELTQRGDMLVSTHVAQILSEGDCNGACAPQPVLAIPGVTLFHGDAQYILSLLRSASVDCIVTSPPYYGQRDYGMDGQLGLEDHPREYIAKLVAVFREAQRVLKPTGSLWVNLGDTYWSGKGAPTGPDAKQRHRRFIRPQDRTGKQPWCTPKQLLLIPHRFAIAMQDDGWIVRNDNVWHKPRPMPDPVDDRCALSHEYMFHFVTKRRYYFDAAAVAVHSTGPTKRKAPSSVWVVPTVPSGKKHAAVFPEGLVTLPITATCPPDGVLLDPFCGTGTALTVALRQAPRRSVIGIDISLEALTIARKLLLPT